MGLNSKQKAFAEFYDGNGTEAAVKAGYSAKTAAFQASRLLKNVKVQAIIENRERRESRKRIANRHQRQEFWTGVMDDKKADMKDRLKASELLGKSECDFTDRVEHSGAVETVVVIREGQRDGG